MIGAPPRAAAPAPARRAGPELTGILLTLLATACFGAMDGLSKFLVQHYPAPLVLWLRHLAAVPVALVLLAPKGPLRLLRTEAPGLQAARATLMVVMMGLALLSFRVMPIAETQAIFAAAPLLVTALSVPLLGERVGWRRTLAVAVGFAGVLVLLRPGLGVLQPGALPALASAFLYALYTILTRRGARADSAETSFMLQTVLGAALLTLVGPFFWVSPEPWHWALILLHAALGAFGHLSLVRALTLAPPVVVQPFTYTQLVYGLIVGYLAFGDVPDRWMLLGSGIVVAAGVYAAVRTHRRAALLPPAPAATPTPPPGRDGGR